MTNKSIFTRIINGEIPSYKIYEDDLFIAILDINPKQLGHTLLIPKNQKINILHEDHVVLSNINLIGQKLSKHLMHKLNAEGIRWQFNSGAEAGQEIFHTHMHLVPHYADKSKTAKVDKEIFELLIVK